MQSVMLLGRLTSDPESFDYKKGTGKVCKLRMACTHTHGKKNPQTQKWEGEVSAFITVKVFDGDKFKLASLCMERLEKGSVICVKGKFMTETWIKDNVQQYALVLTAESVQFVNGRKETPQEESSREEEPVPATSVPDDDNIPF